MLKCEDCRFWEYVQLDGDDRRVGICRRHAPSGIFTSEADLCFEWPFVGDDDWCGEFKPKESIDDLTSLLPNKYKERTEEIIEIIRRHKKSPWQIVKELRKLGIIAKTTYWRDVRFYKPIIEKLKESEGDAG